MRTWLRSHAHLAILAGILLAGFVLRCWGLQWGLYDATISRRPHPDEWTIFYLFQWFDASHSLSPCAPHSSQCFFDWGMTFPYLAFASHFLTAPLLNLVPAGDFGPTVSMQFVRTVLEGRIWSLGVSTGTILLVYALGRVCYGRLAGLVAATVIAFGTLPIQLAHFGTPDATTSFFATAALLVTASTLVFPTGHRFALAGFLVGLAAGTEYHMVLLVVPMVVAWLLCSERRPEWAASAFLCCVGAFLFSNPYIVVDFSSFQSALRHSLNIRTVDSAAQYGDRWVRYQPAALYVLRFPLGYGAGWPLAGCMSAAVLWCAARRRKTDILLLAWLIPYFLLVTWSSAKFMRYSAPLFPVLAVFTGAFVQDATRILANVRVRVLLAAAAAGVLIYTSIYDAAYIGLFSTADARTVASTWLVDHSSPRTLVAYEQLPNGVVNMPYFVPDNSHPPCFAQFQSSRLTGAVRFVILDSYSLDEHPRVPSQVVKGFRRSVVNGGAYRIVEQVHDVPTFLGLRFSIDGAPHDWRYADHIISIYRRSGTTAGVTRFCYPTVNQAIAALYPSLVGS